jgi:predicted metal-binding membrane protein
VAVRLSCARRPDGGTQLAGALLTAIAVFAWTAVAARAGATEAEPAWLRPGGEARTLVPATSEPLRASGEGAIAALRVALGARGLPASVVDGPMHARRYDAQRETDGSEGFWPRGAWLISSAVGQWWVWGTGAATPADEAARAASAQAASFGGPRDAWATASAHAVDSLGDLGDFLPAWCLVVLAVVLPGAVPVLAAYGASQRARSGADRAAVHRLLFASATVGPWLVAGVAFHAGKLAVAAAGPLATHSVGAVSGAAVGMIALALYRASPLGESAVRLGRRSAMVWAARAGPGCRGALAAGWAHGLASVAAGGPLVVPLVLGAAALPWMLATGVLLTAERILPGGERTARATGLVLIALALCAAAWPAPVAALLRGTLPRP